MSLDATVSGASSNSYSTVDGVSALLAERLGAGTDWEDAGENDQAAACITATRRLDQEAYEGCKTSYLQALQFPRFGIYDQDDNLYDASAIPPPILLAHAELCLALIRDPELLDDTGLEGFSDLSVGSVALKMRNQSSGKLPAHVARYLRDFRTAGDGEVRLVRG